MILRRLWLLASFVLSVFADVKFTKPEPGATIEAGGTLTIEWEESGESPSLDSLLSYQLFLCAGGNDDGTFIPLKTLVPTGSFSTGNTASSMVEVGLGEDVENAYFIKMISAAQGGSVINYSPRFSISGMTGTFPATVTAGLASVDGTEGPATENNIQTNQQGVGTAPGPDGDFGVPYTMQTGATRYAPMPKLAPTKITAQKPTPLHPTSAVQFASTFLPTPSQKLTVTQSYTFSVVSSENTVAAQEQPTDGAMQKFLNRWKD